MNYQWYPGHMTKAVRMMQEDMKLIDLVIEILDARIPVSSRNPDIDNLAGNKARILILNKADLADPNVNKEWKAYYEEKGFHVLEMNARNKASMKDMKVVIDKACASKRERDLKRGIKNRPVRTMVVGIPNVGKSTFINSYAGKACAKTGNRPGVTKGKQWIKLDKTLELLDTPGILWPKFEDQETGMHLAFIGSMNDEILHMDELAMDFIAYLSAIYPKAFFDRYQIDIENKIAEEILKEICDVRKCYKKGEEPDYLRAANLVMDDFRNGNLGRISLERPADK